MTSDRVPTQTAPLWVNGPPEGRDDGPLGFVEIDYETGIHWLKTTTQGYTTGWVQFGTGGNGPSGFSRQGEVAPEGVEIAPPGTFYRRADSNNWEIWYKESGTGSTGWYLIFKLI